MSFFISLIVIIMGLINVILSQKLKFNSNNNNFDFSIGVATFGNIPYGQKLVGKPIYAFNDTDSEIACKDIALPEFNRNDTNNFLSSQLNILLIERGNCTFVTKARNAQFANAHLLIIIDYTEEKAENVYMMDDGTGYDIFIPTVLISKPDGKKLLEAIKKDKDLTVTISFDENKKDEVIFETVMSSSNLELYKLLSEFSPFINSFDEKDLGFYPVYYSISNPSSFGIEDTTNCYFNGKYCYFLDQEAINLGIKKGIQILDENIRQICIFRARSKERNFSLFMDYMQKYFIKCLMVDSPSFTKNCAEESMKEIGMTDAQISSVNTCINDSFESNGDNFYLREEKKFQKKMNVVISPSIIVNRRLIYGRHTIYNLFEAICFAFKKQNNVCKDLGFSIETNSGSVVTTSVVKNSGLSTKTVILIVVLIVVFNLIIIIACRIYLKRKMKAKLESGILEDQITSTVTNYMALREK